VTILSAARVMEQAPSAELFRNPLNPYTRGLLESIPGADGHHHRRLRAIAGTIPNALHPPSGCRFHPRCPMVIDDCARIDPPLVAKAPQHWAACIRV
jgi:oligopeptide/dipeptide ABC transporter ATP-binding protein